MGLTFGIGDRNFVSRLRSLRTNGRVAAHEWYRSARKQVLTPAFGAISNSVSMAIDWQTFRLTLELAFAVSFILFLLGLPIAYWIAFSRWRWKFLFEALVALPIVLPPTVLGFYVLVALGPRSPLGRWWISLTGHTLAFTFSGLIIGSIIYSLPFAVQPFAAAFLAADRKLIAASATLGASPFRTFRTVTIPLSVSGIVTGI